jgi:hypothetical protein
VTRTYTRRIALRPPDLVQRLWYRWLRVSAPLLVSKTGPRTADWARLVPYRWRAFHRRYAERHGFFWLPCVLCDRPFGGHESGATVPDPIEGPGRGIVICSRCTRAGRGWVVARHPIEDELDAIYNRHEHGHDDLTPGCPDCETINAEIIALARRLKDQP